MQVDIMVEMMADCWIVHLGIWDVQDACSKGKAKTFDVPVMGMCR